MKLAFRMVSMQIFFSTIFIGGLLLFFFHTLEKRSQDEFLNRNKIIVESQAQQVSLKLEKLEDSLLQLYQNQKIAHKIFKNKDWKHYLFTKQQHLLAIRFWDAALPFYKFKKNLFWVNPYLNPEWAKIQFSKWSIAEEELVSFKTNKGVLCDPFLVSPWQRVYRMLFVFQDTDLKRDIVLEAFFRASFLEKVFSNVFSILGKKEGVSFLKNQKNQFFFHENANQIGKKNSSKNQKNFYAFQKKIPRYGLTLVRQVQQEEKSKLFLLLWNKIFWITLCLSFCFIHILQFILMYLSFKGRDQKYQNKQQPECQENQSKVQHICLCKEKIEKRPEEEKQPVFVSREQKFYLSKPLLKKNKKIKEGLSLNSVKYFPNFSLTPPQWRDFV